MVCYGGPVKPGMCISIYSRTGGGILWVKRKKNAAKTISRKGRCAVTAPFRTRKKRRKRIKKIKRKTRKNNIFWSFKVFSNRTSACAVRFFLCLELKQCWPATPPMMRPVWPEAHPGGQSGPMVELGRGNCRQTAGCRTGRRKDTVLPVHRQSGRR